MKNAIKNTQELDRVVRQLTKDSGATTETTELATGFGITLRVYRKVDLTIDADIVKLDGEKAVELLSRELTNAREWLADDTRALVNKLAGAPNADGRPWVVMRAVDHRPLAVHSTLDGAVDAMRALMHQLVKSAYTSREYLAMYIAQVEEQP